MEGNRFMSRGKTCVLIGFADISEVEQMNTDLFGDIVKERAPRKLVILTVFFSSYAVSLGRKK